MTAPSYLSTFLWTQQLRGSAAFATKFPGAWLVWEPGAWQAPAPNVRSTLAIDPKASAPKHGDALCFLLGLAPEGRTLKIGREPDNEVLISDGTVSRHHLLLTAHEGQWRVRAVEQRVATLSGSAVPEHDVPIGPGQVLTLGGVKLSFHDTSSLLIRLAQ